MDRSVGMKGGREADILFQTTMQCKASNTLQRGIEYTTIKRTEEYINMKDIDYKVNKTNKINKTHSPRII